MKTNKGYRNINLHGASIRDWIQIINANGGFQLCQESGWGPVIGKLVFDILPKGYFDCVMENTRLNKQKHRQLTRKVLQLTKR